MSRAPLAERLRPTTLDAIVGHHEWVGPDGPLRQAVEADQLTSVLLWGPPGCGKTTLARVLAAASGRPLRTLSAVLDGVKDLRAVLAEADDRVRLGNPGLALFVDEIHRWNKAQQDALLPHVERGTVLLLGATTENPRFEVIPALRSRVRVVRLAALTHHDLASLIARAVTSPEGLGGRGHTLDDDAIDALVHLAAGDARRLLGLLERAATVTAEGAPITAETLVAQADEPGTAGGPARREAADATSAFIKSMRGSDPDAAVYWLARLLELGQPIEHIARRLVVFAAEDVGNADPRALSVAVAALHASQQIGLPEARIPLSQATLWLACAPKSDAAYRAIDAALADVRRTGALPAPPWLRNPPPPDAPAYTNPHRAPHRVTRQALRPPEVAGITYYDPAPHGEERIIGERLAWWAKRRS